MRIGVMGKKMSLEKFFRKYNNLYEDHTFSPEAKEALKAVLDYRTTLQKQLSDRQISK